MTMMTILHFMRCFIPLSLCCVKSQVAHTIYWQVQTMAAALAINESLQYDDLSLDYLDNYTSETGDSSAGGLIDVYFSTNRFAAETVCALVAAAANVLVLVAMRRAYDIMAVGQNRTSTAYSILFVNLSIANSLSCILSWLANNSFFLFQSQLIHLLIVEPCLFFIYLMAALFVSTAFVIVSTLTMLGFSAVQYLAVRRVTHGPSTASSVRRVRLFVMLAWTFSLLGGIAPFSVMLIFARGLDSI